MKPTHLLRAFLAGSSLLMAPALHAQLYWDGTTTTGDADGGDGTWDNTTTNWDDAATGGADSSWTAAELAVFGATAGTVTLGDNIDTTGITFDTGGYVIDPDGGGSFDITFSSAGNIAVNTGLSTINASLGGSSKITKTGSGELVLRGANTFTGGFDISSGTVNITDGANEGAYFGATTNTVTFTGDAELYNQNNTVAMAQNFAINSAVAATFSGAFGEKTQINGVLSGSGDMIIQGRSAGYQTSFNNNDNTFTGGIQINGNSGHAVLHMNSLLDSASSSVFGLASDGNDGQFIFRGNDTDNIVFDNRVVTLTGNGNAGTNLGRLATIRNDNSAGATMTINTSLDITGTGNKKFVLAGSNTGNNTFAGNIIDAAAADETLTLYKQDSGKWILGGVNTYEGDTIVDAGTLELALNAELLFVIGALGENNGIIGDASNATVNLDGIFRFNLTGASTTLGDNWFIVDEANLNETYQSNFNVASTNGAFTETGSGIWTRDENGITYEFTQSDGLLTVVPEPSTALLGAIGFLALLRRRR